MNIIRKKKKRKSLIAPIGAYRSEETLTFTQGTAAAQEADDGHQCARSQENVGARLIVEGSFSRKQQRLIEKQPDG